MFWRITPYVNMQHVMQVPRWAQTLHVDKAIQVVFCASAPTLVRGTFLCLVIILGLSSSTIVILQDSRVVCGLKAFRILESSHVTSQHQVAAMTPNAASRQQLTISGSYPFLGHGRGFCSRDVA